MLLRIQSPRGQARLQITTESIQIVTEMVREALKYAKTEHFHLARDPKGSDPISSTKGMNHGDLIYLIPDDSYILKSNTTILESEPVDAELAKMTGRIPRTRSQYCKHPPGKSMCEYCVDLEPYDKLHLKEIGVKHLSFHSFMRKRVVEIQKVGGLETVDYSMKSCAAHEKYPDGICSKCQISPITLSVQVSSDLLAFLEFSSFIQFPIC